MKPGKLEEQPMPLMVATWCLGIWSSTRAFWTAARTPKSPHPGHQSGSTLPLRSAITIRLGTTTSVAIGETPSEFSKTVGLRSLHHDLMRGHRKIRLAGKLVLHRFDDVVRHKGLAVILANVPVGNEARFAAQVARELATEVVLDNDGMFRVLQN